MPNWWLEDMSGALHKASFSRLTLEDIRTMSVIVGWSGSIAWKKELERSMCLVYKLTDVATNTVQGAISMNDEGDHVFINLIESASQKESGHCRCCNETLDSGIL
jgi:hypothetical protein